MKKRYGLLIGLLALSAVAVGCGKNKNEGTDATPTPTPVIETSGQDDNLVSMEQSTGIDKSRITKIMGVKTATASELVLTNNTGLEIEAFYTRPSGEEDWSEDFIQEKFTLKDKEQALFYYDPARKDASGNAVTKYDLRVSYTDEEESDCLFRNLTLSDMEELKLNMEDGVPFVTYISLSTKREISTLEDAKARMGRTDEDDSDEDSENTSEATETPEVTEEPSQAPEEPGDDDPYDSGSGDKSAAEAYIGQGIDSLAAQFGSGDGAEYEENPEDGSTVGYHYYGDFTVTTQVDENGNETITGIW